MNSIFGMRSLLLGIILVACFGIGSVEVEAQIVLYVEIMTEEKPIKYYEGQYLMFKTKDYPDEWQDIKITRLIDEEKIILFEGGMLNLEDIIAIRRTRPWATTIGYMLQTFGVAWFAFGGVAHFTTSSFDFGMDTFVIGGTALASGWLIRKLFKYKKYKIGKKVRLKILDLSWPDPTGQ